MLEEAPKKDIIFMTDADFCYVSNRTGEYNDATQECLRDNSGQIIHVAIITGRNAADLRAFLNDNKKAQNLSGADWKEWKQNGLDAVEADIGSWLEKEGGGKKLKTSVVCIPSDLILEKNGSVKKPNYSFNNFKLIKINALNQNSPAEARAHINKNDSEFIIVDNAFNDMRVKKILAGDHTFGAKGDQVKFYLESLPRKDVVSAAKIYMDDVSDNVVEVFTKNPDVISVLNNIEMGPGYNKQALDLAIKAANAEEEEREKTCQDLIRAAIEFKQFRTQFSKEAGRKELNHEDEITEIKKNLQSDVDMKNGDWFKAVSERLNADSKAIVEQKFQEAIVLRKSNAPLQANEAKLAREVGKEPSSIKGTHPIQKPHSPSVSAASIRSSNIDKRAEEKILPESDCDKVIIGLTALAIGGVAVGCASALGVGLVVAVPVGAVVAVAVAVGAFAVIKSPENSPGNPKGNQFTSPQNIFSSCNYA